jgi:glycosyltransferase involved in cell wall biosynthesis
MRIARIRHLFYPYMPRDYFYELSVRQAENGHDVDVLTWRKNGCSPEKEDGRFVVHRLPGLNVGLPGMIEEYPYLPGLPGELRSLNPDIVHAESHLFLPTVQAVRAARKFGLPCVVTVHGISVERGLAINAAQNLYLRTIGSRIFKNADKIICLTRQSAATVAGFGCPPEKTAVIPNAVDTTLFSPGLKRNDNLIVWVGRFVPEKGVEYLIKSARSVANSIRNIKFLMIGYGPQKGRALNLAQHYGLCQRNIDFVGRLDRAAIASVLRKATLFVFPSLTEGMPVALMEAMSSGVPTVGFDVPGVNDLVVDGENGFLVPPRDSKSFANAIISLVEDGRKRKRMSKSSREVIVRGYSWEKVLKEIDKVYNEIAD